MPMPLMPFPGGRPSQSLKTLIRDAGLLANMKMCLDPGDRNSWPGSGQTLFDVSGNGYHFNLGASSGAGADDPAFVGRVGAQTDGEYFNSPSGGVGFSLASGANDTWLNGLHKTGYNFSICTIEYFTGTYGAGFTTKAGAINSNNAGVSNYVASNNSVFTIGNGSTAFASTSTLTLPTNTPFLLGVSRRYNSTTSRDTTWQINGGFESIPGTSSFTPSGSNSSAARYGLALDGSTAMAAGRRLYGLAMFDRLLTQTEWATLRSRLLKRWPTI